MTEQARNRGDGLCPSVSDLAVEPRQSGSRAVSAVLTRWRERRFARRRARDILKAYHVVHALHPDLKGERLYVASLTSACGLEESEARTRVTRASRSFAMWPAARAVRLRDVVEYVVVADYMAREPRPLGVLSNLGTVVSSIVPRNL